MFTKHEYFEKQTKKTCFDQRPLFVEARGRQMLSSCDFSQVKSLCVESKNNTKFEVGQN